MLVRRISTAILVLVGSLSLPAMSWGVDYRLLPANTEVVLTINIKQIIDSDLVKTNADVINQFKGLVEGQIPPEISKFLEQSGVDLSKDLTSLTAALPGTKSVDDLFLILEGSFNAAKVEAAAKNAAKGGDLKISKIGAVSVFELKAADKTVFAAHLGKSIVVASSADQMKAAIASSAGNTVAAAKVKELLKATNEKQSLSFVMTGAALAGLTDLAGNLPGNLPIDAIGPFIKGLKGANGAITITKDIGVQLGAALESPQQAKEIASTGEGALLLLKPLAKQQIAGNPQLAPLMDVVNTLRISSAGSNVNVTANLSKAVLEKLLQNLIP